MIDDQDGKKPTLSLVSENQNAPSKADRERQRAKEEAERAPAIAAATMLRAIAGSASAASGLRNELVRAILAEEAYFDLSGQWLASWERTKALAMPEPEPNEARSEYSDRKFEVDLGMQRIVQGALRLAAHRVLGEEPHFGGKHSERLIDEGIAVVERAKRPSPPPKPEKKMAHSPKAKSSWNLVSDLSAETKGPAKPPGLPPCCNTCAPDTASYAIRLRRAEPVVLQ